MFFFCEFVIHAEFLNELSENFSQVAIHMESGQTYFWCLTNHFHVFFVCVQCALHIVKPFLDVKLYDFFFYRINIFLNTKNSHRKLILVQYSRVEFRNWRKAWNKWFFLLRISKDTLFTMWILAFLLFLNVYFQKIWGRTNHFRFHHFLCTTIKEIACICWKNVFFLHIMKPVAA